MGIELDPASIEKNPGRRLIAKLCLNSLWGRFGMRQNMPKNEIINSLMRYYELINDDAIDLSTFSWFDIDSDELLECVYKLKDDFITEQEGYKLSVPISAFTTCYARMRLYGALEIAGEDALYCDTDSLIFIERNEKELFKLGDNLGDFTPEELHIIEFAATAPKSYGYITNDGAIECKVKGFKLDHKTLKIVNYNTLKNQVMGGQNVSVPITRFVNDRKNKIVKTVHLDRVQQITFDKRTIKFISNDNIDTVLFGYDNKNENIERTL